MNGRRPLRGFGRHFAVLCSLLLFVTLIVSLAELSSYFSGRMFTSGKADQLRLLREGVYAILLLDFGFCVLWDPGKFHLSRTTLMTIGTVGILCCLTVAYSIYLGLPLTVILAGMRFFEYVPLAFVSGWVYRKYGMAPFRIIARAGFVLLVLQTVFAVVETRLPFSYYGRTFLGSRAFGTFQSPNLFGPAMAFIYLLIRQTLSVRARWIAQLLTLFDVVASGSRAAMLDVVIIEACFFLVSIRAPAYRSLMATSLIALAPLALLAVTAPQLTGRDTGIGAGGFERFGVWDKVIGHVKTGFDLMMGWGMGLGSNTIVSLYDWNYPGSYIADNTLLFLLGSYGLIGVIFCVAVCLWLLYRLRGDGPGLALACAFLLQLMVVQVMEIYPVNAIAMMLYGLALAVVRERECVVQAEDAAFCRVSHRNGI